MQVSGNLNRSRYWIAAAAIVIAVAIVGSIAYTLWRQRQQQAGAPLTPAIPVMPLAVPEPAPASLAPSLLEAAAKDIVAGRYGDAAGKAQSVIEMLPEAGDPLRLHATQALGRALLEMAQADQAIAALEQVRDVYLARSAGDHPEALAAEAGILRARLMNGEIKESLAGNRQLERRVASHPALRIAVLREQALAMVELGQATRAARVIDQALKLSRAAAGPEVPDDPQLTLEKARIDMFRGLNDQARKLTDSALALLSATLAAGHPALAQAQVLMGRLQRLAGNPAAAIELQVPALLALEYALPDDHPARAAAEMELGRSLLASGEPVAAEEMLRSSRARFASHFGDGAWQTGEPELAMADALAQLGHSDAAKAMRAGAATRLREQLPRYHPAMSEIRVRYRR